MRPMGALISAFLVTALVACGGDDDGSGEPAGPDKNTPEYQLAVIDSRNPAPAETSVASYARLLDELDPRCPDLTRRRIAEVAVNAQESISKAIRERVTILMILEAVNELVPDEGAELQGPDDCLGYFAKLAVEVKRESK